MQKVERNLFEMKAKELGLKRVDSDYWFLPGCDLMFKHGYQWDCACINAYGVVPMDLSIELYKYFKNVEVQTIANTRNFELLEPLSNASEVVKHESIRDIDLMMLEAKTSGKKIDEVWKEKIEKALKEDYDNCYTEYYYIQSLPAFVLFVEQAQAYYNRKREQDKPFVHQL